MAKSVRKSRKSMKSIRGGGLRKKTKSLRLKSKRQRQRGSRKSSKRQNRSKKRQRGGAQIGVVDIKHLKDIYLRVNMLIERLAIKYNLEIDESKKSVIYEEIKRLMQQNGARENQKNTIYELIYNINSKDPILDSDVFNIMSITEPIDKKPLKKVSDNIEELTIELQKVINKTFQNDEISALKTLITEASEYTQKEIEELTSRQQNYMELINECFRLSENLLKLCDSQDTRAKYLKELLQISALLDNMVKKIYSKVENLKQHVSALMEEARGESYDLPSQQFLDIRSEISVITMTDYTEKMKKLKAQVSAYTDSLQNPAINTTSLQSVGALKEQFGERKNTTP